MLWVVVVVVVVVGKAGTLRDDLLCGGSSCTSRLFSSVC